MVGKQIQLARGGSVTIGAKRLVFREVFPHPPFGETTVWFFLLSFLLLENYVPGLSISPEEYKCQLIGLPKTFT